MDALEGAIAAERAWIGRCNDVSAMLDRMAEYRDMARAAQRSGNDRAVRRISELLDLAEDRVAELKAAKLRAARRPAPEAEVRSRLEPVAAAVAPKADVEEELRAARAEIAATREAQRMAVLAREAAERREREAAEERERLRVEQEKWKAEERQREAARVRVAKEREREAARVRMAEEWERETLIEKAADGRPRGVTTGRPGSGGMPQSVVAPAPGTVRVYSRDSMLEADRQALAGAGRWPPPAVSPRGPIRAPDADWPVEWTLRGGDLAKFRRKHALAPTGLAARLGVPVDEILGAEARPEAKVRPALQAALREAIRRADVEARRQQAMEASRDARGEAGGEARAEADTEADTEAGREARAEAAVEAGIIWEAIGEKKEAGTPELAEATARGRADSAADAEGHARRSEIVEGRGPMLTGADLGRWRAAAGLTQRQAAEKLGVAHGTVAKAELAPQKELGEQLGAALSLNLPPKPKTR